MTLLIIIKFSPFGHITKLIGLIIIFMMNAHITILSFSLTIFLMKFEFPQPR
jgi:hypothetical protein